LTMATILCLSASLAHGQRGGERSRGNESRGESSEQRGSEGKEGNREGGREGESKQGGNSAPGGDWSERSHSGKQSNGQANNQRGESGPGNAAQKNSNQASGKDAAGAAAYKSNQQPQATGKEGAAAGAAAENKNQPQYSGAQGAAAGAAAANKNQPQYSGAQGAAAGAAAANKNQPQYSGAVVVQPQYSGTPGAVGAPVVNNYAPQNPAQGVVGAPAVNTNQPQYSGAQGAAVGAAAANRNAPPATGAAGAPAGYAAVKSSFTGSNVYSQQWCLDHPGTWFPTGWVAGAAWNSTPWDAVAGLCGYGSVQPISYDYGVNITAQNGNVFVNGQNVGTTAAFSQQAAELAYTGTAAEVSTADEWLPLGVFAMVRNEQQHPQLIVQLAINKQGILRGNYTDELTDSTLPIHGAADKASQRAAWTVGGNKQTVMEAGLSDLTDAEAPALIHKNGKTDHWLLIRLARPQAGPN
jgi:hypothetical protein